MKGLKLIPAFLALIVLSYFGMLFVEANRTEVVISFWQYQSHPAALGLVVLTSVLIGMVISGCLCSVEMLALYVQNRKLRRHLGHYTPRTMSSPVDRPMDSGALPAEGPRNLE